MKTISTSTPAPARRTSIQEKFAGIDRLPAETVAAQFSDMTGGRTWSPLMMRTALKYAAWIDDSRERGVPLPASAKAKLAALLGGDYNRFRLAGGSAWAFGAPGHVARGGEMAKKAEKKEVKARVTAASVLVREFAKATPPADGELIETVKKATGSDKFDARQLAWYRWRYKKGRLKGMDGTPHKVGGGNRPGRPKKRLVVKTRKK